MNVSTDLFRVFYQVGLYLSFSKAAKALGVSQSAISQSIKLLEKELDFSLFVRTTKTVTLTPRGKELFEAVSRSFGILDDAVEQLKKRNQFEQESFRLAAPDSVCSYYLLPYFGKWQTLYPNVGIQIVNRPSMQCVELVKNGEVDAAVTTIDKDIVNDNQLEVRNLITIHDVFIGGSKYKNYQFVSLEKLFQEPLILLETSAMSRKFFEEVAGSFRVNPAIELGSIDVIVNFLKMNMGISFLPKEYVSKELSQGKLVEIEVQQNFPNRQLGFIKSRLVPTKVSTAQFIDLINNP